MGLYNAEFKRVRNRAFRDPEVEQWWWGDGAASGEPVWQIEAKNNGAHMWPEVGRQVGSLWVGHL